MYDGDNKIPTLVSGKGIVSRSTEYYTADTKTEYIKKKSYVSHRIHLRQHLITVC